MSKKDFILKQIANDVRTAINENRTGDADFIEREQYWLAELDRLVEAA